MVDGEARAWADFQACANPGQICFIYVIELLYSNMLMHNSMIFSLSYLLSYLNYLQYGV